MGSDIIELEIENLLEEKIVDSIVYRIYIRILKYTKEIVVYNLRTFKKVVKRQILEFEQSIPNKKTRREN